MVKKKEKQEVAEKKVDEKKDKIDEIKEKMEETIIPADIKKKLLTNAIGERLYEE